MIYNILAVGDVVGACGVKHLSRCLRSLKKRKSIHFTVVNGENAAMVGGGGFPAYRHRNVTIWARVHSAIGRKVPSE